jgi:hypothetical protein
MASTAPYYNAGGKAPVIVQGHVVQGYHPPSSNLALASTYDRANVVAQDLKPDAPSGRPCRDAFWAILFYAHLAAIGYLAAVFAPTMVNDVAQNVAQGGQRNLQVFRFLDEQATNDSGNGSQQDFNIDPSSMLIVLCLASVIGFVFSSLALGFMMGFAESLIKVALCFNIGLFGATAALSLLGGAIGPALMSLLMCAFSGYYAWRVWGRIPFAAANLVTAVSAVRANMGLAFFAYSSMAVLFGWSVFWSISSISTIFVMSGCNGQGECDSEVNPGIAFLFLISYYWTIQVITNVVHVTTSGTVGTWWMVPAEANGCCSSAVCSSYMRSITTSFGSICLGSLIVAIIQAVKEIIHSARENGDSIVACCAECLIGCLESLVEYFNKWAFGTNVINGLVDLCVFLALFSRLTFCSLCWPVRVQFHGGRVECHDAVSQSRMDCYHYRHVD